MRAYPPLLTALVLMATVLTAEGGTAVKRFCLDDPVLARLGLTAKQVRALDELFNEAERQYDEICRSWGTPDLGKMTKEEIAALNRKNSEETDNFYAERNRKVREMLPVELRSRYDEGQKLYQAFKAKLRERCQAAGRPPTYQEERELKAELERQLDEKIGKRPVSGLTVVSAAAGLAIALVLGLAWFVRRRRQGAPATAAK